MLVARGFAPLSPRQTLSAAPPGKMAARQQATRRPESWQLDPPRQVRDPEIGPVESLPRLCKCVDVQELATQGGWRWHHLGHAASCDGGRG